MIDSQIIDNLLTIYPLKRSRNWWNKNSDTHTHSSHGRVKVRMRIKNKSSSSKKENKFDDSKFYWRFFFRCSKLNGCVSASRFRSLGCWCFFYLIKTDDFIYQAHQLAQVEILYTPNNTNPNGFYSCRPVYCINEKKDLILRNAWNFNEIL